MNGGEMDPDMAALIDQADDGPRVPDLPRRPRGVESSDPGGSAMFGSTLAAAPITGRREPTPRPVPGAGKLRSWRDVARLGTREPGAVGADLFNAHAAYVMAKRAVLDEPATDEQARAAHLRARTDAGNALGVLLALVCREMPAPLLAGFLHEWCPMLDAEQARRMAGNWLGWQKRKGAAMPPPPVPTPVPATPPTTTPPAARPIEPTRPAPTMAATVLDRDALIRALFYKGVSQRDIAEQVGTSRANVRKRLTKMGLS